MEIKTLASFITLNNIYIFCIINIEYYYYIFIMKRNFLSG